MKRIRRTTTGRAFDCAATMVLFGRFLAYLVVFQCTSCMALIPCSSNVLKGVGIALRDNKHCRWFGSSSRCSALQMTDEDSSNKALVPSFSLSKLSRRQYAELTVASIGLGGSFLATRERTATDYGLFGVLPVGPYKTKKTLFESVVPDLIWTADQKFGILNVQVPLRMVIVKLSSGGLFVYNPVAATPEVVSFLRDLEVRHGPVKYLVVGSVAAEHKVYASVMAQKFAQAKVLLQPGQYSFPVNLPNSFLGFPTGGRTSDIPSDIRDAPQDIQRDFHYLTLGPLISKDGAFGETVFFHKPTNTLLVTDTVLQVTKDVPPIYDYDPNPLLFHARDTVDQIVKDNDTTRLIGWRRIALFGLFFTPSAIVIQDAQTAFRNRRPDINKDFFGVYPWDWIGDDQASFDALTGGLLVAPILQKLILNRNPVEVLDFADRVAMWPIERIIPAHFKNDLSFDGKAYRNAFAFLEVGGSQKLKELGLPLPLKADLKTLDEAEVNLIESGAISKVPPMPGGDVSRAEILAQTAYGCRAGICTPRSSP